MKKFLISILAITAVLCGTFGLSACGLFHGSDDGDNNGSSEHKHSFQIVEAVDPTCLSDGNIEYYTCIECGKWFADKDDETEITDKKSVVTPKKAEHDFLNDLCTMCGIHSPTAGLIYTEKGDSYEVSGIINQADVTVVYLADRYNGKPVTSIGNNAFFACHELTEITIPAGVTSIGNYAFDECQNLTNITMTDSVISIGHYAFANCRSLKNIVIPEGVTSISDNLFEGCNSLESVTLGEGVTSIGDSAFEECESLTSFTIPKGVTSIGKKAFYWCLGLKKITIPDRVTSIGDGAFWACKSLEEAVIGIEVTVISVEMFYECVNLKSVTIPVGVKLIDEYAFEKCKNLTTINFSGTCIQWGMIKKYKEFDEDTGEYTVYCINGKVTKN